MKKAVIGLVGLGTMGQSLSLNIESRGFPIAIYNRSPEKTQAFLTGSANGKQVIGTTTLNELVDHLEKPRRVILMVPSGPPVDMMIDQLKLLLDEGDLIIDGGNSHFKETERRAQELEKNGILYLGTGISGGEKGALLGPSMMPGGVRKAWYLVEPIFNAISAKAEDGEPCVAYIGPGGAGHYVKMIHNGIEYGDMQLIAEVYDILHRGLAISNQELHYLFSEWNESELKSYLIGITADILAAIDPITNQPMVDMILDEAKQKGTGKWTSQDSFDIGAAVPTINAAVSSRILSSQKAERFEASKILAGPDLDQEIIDPNILETAKDALYAAKIILYAQGMRMLASASEEYGYKLNLREIAKIWRAGCIIQADLLNAIMYAFERQPDLHHLLLDEAFQKAIDKKQTALREIIKTAINLGIPTPALSSTLSYYDAYRSERLPANLTQAQRDYFGAHTYRRIDSGDKICHTEWEKIVRPHE
jgi:6-phosphogluconate dehydrogenase